MTLQLNPGGGEWTYGSSRHERSIRPVRMAGIVFDLDVEMGRPWDPLCSLKGQQEGLYV